MAFERQTARTPVAIAGIEIRLFSPDPASARPPGADFSVQVRYSDDSVDDMRTKAETEILPE